MQQHEPHVIEFLDLNEFRVLKIIKIEGPKGSSFNGYLPYIRQYIVNEYTAETNDIIDQKILELIQRNLPNSFLNYSIDILFKGDLEKNLKFIEGGSRKNKTIHFSPLLPYENVQQYVGKYFNAYPINFNARMLFENDIDKSHYINDYLLCQLPHDKLEELMKSIQTI